MASVNPRNTGTATGRLTKDPVVFENRDGSRKVVLSVAMRNNYKDADGEVGSQFADFTGFVAKDAKAAVYEMVHSGDLVTVSYELRNDNWTDGQGERHFDLTLRITGIDMLESKATTKARLEERNKA